MPDRTGEVVVITGASAGIGRAAVHEFAHRHARIALIAREPERLEADAERAERELGPIGIWVDNAMATVFAPFADIAPEDFRRVTDVTYRGFAWDTMAALKRMRPRGRGTILQVGSALGVGLYGLKRRKLMRTMRRKG